MVGTVGVVHVRSARSAFTQGILRLAQRARHTTDLESGHVRAPRARRAGRTALAYKDVACQAKRVEEAHVAPPALSFASFSAVAEGASLTLSVDESGTACTAAA